MSTTAGEPGGSVGLDVLGNRPGRGFCILTWGHGLVGAAPLDWPKGSTWLLQRASQPRAHARHLAPLALGGRVEIG